MLSRNVESSYHRYLLHPNLMLHWAHFFIWNNNNNKAAPQNPICCSVALSIIKIFEPSHNLSYEIWDCAMSAFFVQPVTISQTSSHLYSLNIVGHKATCEFCGLEAYGIWNAICVWTAIGRWGVLSNQPPCGSWDLLTYVSSSSNGNWKFDVLSHIWGMGLSSFGHTAQNRLYCEISSCCWPFKLKKN